MNGAGHNGQNEPAVIALLQELRNARRELLMALDGLSPTDVWTEDGWSIHDLLGHLASWDRDVLAALQERQIGRSSYELPGYQNDDQWNERIRARKAGLAPEQVRMDFLMARRELEDVLREAYISEEDLAAPIAVSWSRTTTVAQLVRGSCIEHEREHAAGLWAWRASRSPR
ncbi:MAG TPA: DinB family protein [Ardenticatenaceae bacterium]|nr:DinB family protein [Ardenticatenaceae bacterium]